MIAWFIRRAACIEYSAGVARLILQFNRKLSQSSWTDSTYLQFETTVHVYVQLRRNVTARFTLRLE